MPSVYDLKPRFQSLLRPLIKRLAAAGFTANTVTVLALIGSVAVGVCAVPAKKHPLLLLLLPGWLFAHLFAPWAAPINASLAFAVAYLAVWFAVMWLLDRRGLRLTV